MKFEDYVLKSKLKEVLDSKRECIIKPTEFWPNGKLKQFSMTKIDIARSARNKLIEELTEELQLEDEEELTDKVKRMLKKRMESISKGSANTMKTKELYKKLFGEELK